ncbi:MAG: hypothetical protein R3325_11195 [Thermoanaerobaculia bacterium]|nr:hypothetical protein [Thermoanaerobaculia bacterium]
MTIEFLEPIERAWRGMARILFAPFKLEKWIVLGFAAWLAGLAGGNNGGVGWNLGNPWDDDDSASILEEVVEDAAVPAAFQSAQVESVEDAVAGAFDWLPFAAGCLVFLIPVVIALVVLMLWLSSRGIFIYLDGVVWNRAQIVEPWKRFRRLGDSLFLWRVGFLVVVLAGVVIGAVGIILAVHRDFGWVLVAPIVALLAFWAVGAAVVDVLLRHFVVPVMYRNDIKASVAWSRFLPTLRAYPLQFLGYLALLFILWILAGLAIALAGFLTCCVGFVLLAIPYVGTVLLLPLLTFLRLFSLEFLRQFGPELDLLAGSPTPPPPGPEAALPA